MSQSQYEAAISEVSAMILAEEQPGFVRTSAVKRVMERAALYLNAGYPVNLSGPAGTGKTTMAMNLAAQQGRPIILIHGDEDFGTADLVGGAYGYRLRKVMDNFIEKVKKTEEDVTRKWVDNRLTVACKHGFTLVYDEFTRSRPEANNVLLSVLEERLLQLPAGRGSTGYLEVHPEFRAIFTSNPMEYAGIHQAQDALKDRMITIRTDAFDRDSEVAIVSAKSGVPGAAADRVVRLVDKARKANHGTLAPSLRASLMIADIMQLSGAEMSVDDDLFLTTCMDILTSGSSKNGKDALSGETLKTWVAEIGASGAPA